MARPIEIRYTVQDGDGKQGNFTLNVASDTPLDEMQPIIDTIGQVLIQLTGGAVIDAQYTVKANLSASTWFVDLANATNPLADVEEGAVFVWESYDGYRTSVRIPTFREDLIVQGTDLVDQADTDVQAFVSFYLNGVDTVAEGGALTGPTAAVMTTSHDFPASLLRSARESFVKSRR